MALQRGCPTALITGLPDGGDLVSLAVRVSAATLCSDERFWGGCEIMRVGLRALTGQVIEARASAVLEAALPSLAFQVSGA